MILDTSALIALLLAEPGFEELLNKVEEADELGIGTPTGAVEILFAAGEQTGTPAVAGSSRG